MGQFSTLRAVLCCALTLQLACDDSDEGNTTSPENTAGTPSASGTGGTPAGSAGSGGAAAGSSAPFSGVSKPGQYSRYDEPIYAADFELTSQYVPVRDGTKLAMDLYRPKDRDGKVVTTPLPVIWMHTPYNRRVFMQSATVTGLPGQTYPGAGAELVKYGYVVAVVDYRGLYASYGKNLAYNHGAWAEPPWQDAYDITEWLAMQPWSTGKIGMWGCSATGGSQLQAASTAPPHLNAIFPMSCEWDGFSFLVPGGMYPPKGMEPPRPRPDPTPEMRNMLAAPVDGDESKALLMDAIASHEGSRDSVGYAPFRDSTAENAPVQWYLRRTPHKYVDTINKSGIAMYLAANWDEATTKQGAFFTFNNVKTPAKLIVGPEAHCAWFSVKKNNGFEIVVEELRFFDYWLKGIDNKIMDEPPVYYYTYNRPAGMEWRSAMQWPLPNEKRTRYYLGASQGLGTDAPTATDGKDEYTVAYDVTPMNFTEKGLVYATEPLAQDVEITGHAVAELWVSSTANDGDFIATFQDVAPDGTAVSYNTNGRLRASLRKLDPAPYENLGLPWHRSYEADVMPLVPNEPTKLEFELLPISIVVKAGHRIRVVVNFAAPVVTPVITPAPKVTLYRDAAHPSAIVLPIIPN
ncbi:MAG TPA: CocE/NonD family hydrolase [Polyangiales bacterium]|nr:CocE/NonD family hydrolase [Polyangiales bacterium]